VRVSEFKDFLNEVLEDDYDAEIWFLGKPKNGLEHDICMGWKKVNQLWGFISFEELAKRYRALKANKD